MPIVMVDRTQTARGVLRLSPSEVKQMALEARRIKRVFITLIASDIITVCFTPLTIALPLAFQNEIWIILTFYLSVHTIITLQLVRQFMQSVYVYKSPSQLSHTSSKWSMNSNHSDTLLSSFKSKQMSPMASSQMSSGQAQSFTGRSYARDLGKCSEATIYLSRLRLANTIVHR